MDDAEILFANILSLGEHATWQGCVDQVEEGLKTWLNTFAKVSFKRIYLVGCGTSYFAAQVGKYAIEHLAHLPVEAHQAFAFSLYTDPALLGPDTLVLGVSTTGSTISVCQALDFARRCGAVTLTFTAAPGSKITEIAQTTILTGGRVTVAVKTETYLQSLICLYLLAIRLAEKLGQLKAGEVEHLLGQINRAEETTRRFFDTQQTEVTKLVEQYSAADMVFVLGTGPNFGTAEEASLKVVEIAKMYSDAKEMEDFFHGYDRELTETCLLFFNAPQGPALQRMLDFLSFTHKVRVPSIVLTTEDNPDLRVLADHLVILPGDLEELFTPLVYIAPFYLFSYHMAEKRGFDPSARRFPGVVALQTRYRTSD